MQFFRLPRQFRNHLTQYQEDKKRQLDNINDLRMDTQLKFKATNNKIEQANNGIDKTNKNLSEYKQKLNNYKKANNKKINELESRINTIQENQKMLIENQNLTLCTVNMFTAFFTKMFGNEFNNTKDKLGFNGNKFSHLEPDINKNNESRNKIQYINSNKKNNSMLRRTNSCFFTINTNNDNGNNNLNNSFTVFNRKSDIVPNLEEDIKENNK